MAVKSFGWGGFGLRLVFALVLVFASYNPTGYSFAHWAFTDFSSFTPVKALAGVVLLIGWVVYARASFRSLGPAGLLLVAALIGTAVWTLSYYGLISARSPGVLPWVVLVSLSLMLAIGISWSHVRRRLSGQVDMDDVEEEG